MPQRLIACLAVLLLGPCSSSDVQWTKPGVIDDERAKDREECLEDGREAVQRQIRIGADPGIGAVPAGPIEFVVDKELFTGCMQARGYRRAQENPAHRLQ